MKPDKAIIVSGVNLYKAGSLKVMQDCLLALSSYVQEEGGRLIALVHKKELYEGYPGIEFLEFPQSRKSWLHRLYYEYIHFRKLSLDYKPSLWLSMHDMTPNVVAPVRAVYCHNTSAFYKSGWREIVCDYRFFLFSLFYNKLYRINIKKNNYVIVQQQWLREGFERIFGIDNVIVASPEIKQWAAGEEKTETRRREKKEGYSFFYPSVPRTYKNFELACRAAQLLQKAGISDFRVYLTLDGSENKYAKELYRKYHTVDNIRFVGFLSREEMEYYYSQSDCLLFPSKLESWGLPVMEAKERAMPVLLADLPYAKETIGAYEQAAFFNPADARELASLMGELIRGEAPFTPTRSIDYKQPYVNTWHALFDMLLKDIA